MQDEARASDEGFLDDDKQDEDPEDLYCGDHAGIGQGPTSDDEAMEEDYWYTNGGGAGGSAARWMR